MEVWISVSPQQAKSGLAVLAETRSEKWPPTRGFETKAKSVSIPGMGRFFLLVLSDSGRVEKRDFPRDGTNPGKFPFFLKIALSGKMVLGKKPTFSFPGPASRPCKRTPEYRCLGGQGKNRCAGQKGTAFRTIIWYELPTFSFVKQKKLFIFKNELLCLQQFCIMI